MSMLSDADILHALGTGDIAISPFDPRRVQPASYDIALGTRFVDRHGNAVWPNAHAGQPHYMQPGQFILGETLECLSLSPAFAARIEGKSSIGRKGLFVHVTAGYIDPGWSGKLTLELFNASRGTILLQPGMLISQLSFYRLSTPSIRPYGHPDLGSHYQGAQSVEASKS